MKILFIAPKYSGGIGGHALRVAKKLRENSFDVKLMDAPKIPIKNLKNPSFAVFSAIKAILSKEKFDVVHAFNVPSAFAMRYVKAKKKVLSVHGVYSEQISSIHSDTTSSTVNLVEAKILKWADKLATNSKNVAKNVDGIFHQAALGSVPQSFKEPEEYHKVNAIGTENVLKLGNEFGFKVVYASSSSVYGNQEQFPIKEDAEKKPLNPYGKSKLKAEQFATKFAKQGVKVIGLRYFNVFGIGQNPNYAGVIPRFIERLKAHEPPIIFGDGKQSRNFTFIDDVVQANILAFESKIDNDFINIASDKITSVLELANLMIKISGLQIECTFENERKGDIIKSQADISLAKNLINWEPKTQLEDGLKKIFPKIS